MEAPVNDWATEIATDFTTKAASKVVWADELAAALRKVARQSKAEGKSEGYLEAAWSMERVLVSEIKTLLHEAKLQSSTE